MKKIKIIISSIMVLALMFSTVAAAPKDKSEKNSGKNTSATVSVEEVDQEAVDEEAVDEEEATDESGGLEELSKGQQKQIERETLSKDILEKSSQINDLKDQYDLIEDKTTTEAQDLQMQIEELKASIEIGSNRVRNSIRQELRQKIRESYTQEEMGQVLEIADELQNMYEGIKILPVDSVVSNKYKFKFDVPPVIKEGRTLIPVRAITQGFGATVDWNPQEEKVTIVKDDTEIMLFIDNNVALVNGEEVQMDTESEIMSSRAVVPLRFIAETFGLNVNWNEDDESIEIEDDEEINEETVENNKDLTEDNEDSLEDSEDSVEDTE